MIHIVQKLALAVLIIISLLISCSAQAFQIPGPLVEPDWLEQHLDQVAILDVREDIESFTRKAVLVRKRFTGDLKIRIPGAHIPGAVLVDFLNIRTSREIDDRRVRRMIPEKAEFEQLMQSWGINKDDTIVIVSLGMSNSDMTMATRLYWQIKYFGHDNLTILNGGMAQWLLEQNPATLESREPAPGNWVAHEMREDISASSADVARAVEDDSIQLVDTRALGFYFGAYKQAYVRRKGHIPGAKVFPNELLTDAEAPVTFAEPEEIKYMANELGIDASSDMITYCNSGQLASGSWFVFSELLGNKNVRLYDGSMHQWALEKHPVKTMILE